jgi:hypothetical protein
MAMKRLNRRWSESYPKNWRSMSIRKIWPLPALQVRRWVTANCCFCYIYAGFGWGFRLLWKVLRWVGLKLLDLLERLIV